MPKKNDSPEPLLPSLLSAVGITQGIEGNPEMPPLVPIKIPPNLRQAFLDLIQENSLLFLVANSPVLKQTLCARARCGLRSPLTSPEEALLTCFYEMSLLLSNTPLTFRYVSARNSGGIDRVVDSIQSGGQAPSESGSVGVCVDNGHKIRKYLVNEFAKTGADVFLFIYDLRKLRGLTPEEGAADLNLAYYGVAPREGLTLRDALVGVIHFTAQ